MLGNPIVEAQIKEEKERREKEAFRYPFIVTCVVDYIEDIKENPSFKIVKQFCDDNHISFSAREYDHRKYEEDREQIYKMPAFHLYHKDGRQYHDTYYWDETPTQKILENIVEWRKQQDEKRLRKEKWERKVAGLIAFFEGLTLKKKPKIIVPSRPKSLPPKIPVEFADIQPPPRKRSL